MAWAKDADQMYWADLRDDMPHDEQLRRIAAVPGVSRVYLAGDPPFLRVHFPFPEYDYSGREVREMCARALNA